MSMMVMELNGMKMRTLMGMTTLTLALVTDLEMDMEVSQAEMVVWSRWNMVRTEFHFTLAERSSLVPAPSPTSL